VDSTGDSVSLERSRATRVISWIWTLWWQRWSSQACGIIDGRRGRTPTTSIFNKKWPSVDPRNIISRHPSADYRISPATRGLYNQPVTRRLGHTARHSRIAVFHRPLADYLSRQAAADYRISGSQIWEAVGSLLWETGGHSSSKNLAMRLGDRE
jgi:hypothetical protein